MLDVCRAMALLRGMTRSVLRLLLSPLMAAKPWLLRYAISDIRSFISSLNPHNFAMTIPAGYVKSSTSPTKTFLDPSPPAEPFINGMTFGSTVDAITGEIHRSIVDIKQSAPQDSSTGKERETYSRKQFSSASEVEKSLSLSFSSSIAFPADGLNISAKRGFDFSDSTTSQAYSHFYMITWESNGKAKALPEKPILHKDAQELLDKKDWAGFRKAYGDYFVHQIQTRARFSALW